MAVAAYYTWDRLGRPLEPATPVREFVLRMKVEFPRAANLFSWYADDNHYQAEPPQDHTPFSQTGWPLASQRWVVHATDIMHRPALGVDCFVLFDYWLGEARAGRMPWLKYMIWQAKRYDVRNNWRPVASSGHFDHVHLSTRTDHDDTHLGSWQVAPKEDELTPQQQYILHVINYRVEGIKAMRDPIRIPAKTFDGVEFPETVEPNLLAQAIRAIPTTAPPVDVDEAAIAAELAEELDIPTAQENAEATADELHERTAD